MIILFTLIFLISVITTIALLIKPSWTTKGRTTILSRWKILLFGLVASFVSLAIIGVLSPKPKTINQTTQKQPETVQEQNINQKPAEKPQTEKDADLIQTRQQFEDRKAELEEADKPHFEWPRVDYRKPVAKVDLNDDKAILKAVGKPVQDTESGADSNGEPMKSYWFSKQIAYGLQVDLSREQISVMWQFNDKDLGKATAAFEEGQQITRALLGGKAGSELYENIAKGLKYDQIITDDGTVIKNARCGAIICRYEIVR